MEWLRLIMHPFVSRCQSEVIWYDHQGTRKETKHRRFVTLSLQCRYTRQWASFRTANRDDHPQIRDHHHPVNPLTPRPQPPKRRGRSIKGAYYRKSVLNPQEAIKRIHQWPEWPDQSHNRERLRVSPIFECFFDMWPLFYSEQNIFFRGVLLEFEPCKASTIFLVSEKNQKMTKKSEKRSRD